VSLLKIFSVEWSVDICSCWDVCNCCGWGYRPKYTHCMNCVWVEGGGGAHPTANPSCLCTHATTMGGGSFTRSRFNRTENWGFQLPHTIQTPTELPPPHPIPTPPFPLPPSLPKLIEKGFMITLGTKMWCPVSNFNRGHHC
jgi:hypothetical protein